MNRQKGLTLLEMILVVGLSAVAGLLSFYEKTADFEHARAKSVGSQLFAYNNAVRAWVSANPGAAAATKSGATWLKPTTCGGTSTVAYLPCSFPDASLSAPLDFGQLSLSSAVATTGVAPNQITTVTTQTTPFLVGGHLRSDLSGLAALVAASSTGTTGSPLPMATDAKFSSAPATAIITMIAGSNPSTDAWLRTDGSNTMNNNITFKPSNAALNRQLIGVSRIQSLAAEAFYIGSAGGASLNQSVIVDADESVVGTLTLQNVKGAANALVVNQGGVTLNNGSLTLNNGNVDVKGGAISAAIFYDSNNTGYKVDPSSLSVVNNLNVNGSLNVGGSSAVSGNSSVGNTLTVGGRANVGEYLYLGASANEGWGCPGAGLVSRTPQGKVLSCENGVWKGGSGLGGLVLGQATGYDVKDGGTVEYDAVCPGDTVMVGLRNTVWGDVFTLLCR